MSTGLIGEVWKLLKPNIEAGDVTGASETLVNYLIEEDYSAHEIKSMFRGDSDIKEALDFYLETPEDGFYHEKPDEDLDDELYDGDENEGY